MIEGPGCECQPVCPPGAIVLTTTQMSEEPLVFSFTSSVFTSISGSIDACTISVVLIPCPIVAQATLHAMRALPTRTPADSKFNLIFLMVAFLSDVCGEYVVATREATQGQNSAGQQPIAKEISEKEGPKAPPVG